MLRLALWSALASIILLLTSAAINSMQLASIVDMHGTFLTGHPDSGTVSLRHSDNLVSFITSDHAPIAGKLPTEALQTSFPVIRTANDVFLFYHHLRTDTSSHTLVLVALMLNAVIIVSLLLSCVVAFATCRSAATLSERMAFIVRSLPKSFHMSRFLWTAPLVAILSFYCDADRDMHRRGQEECFDIGWRWLACCASTVLILASISTLHAMDSLIRARLRFLHRCAQCGYPEPSATAPRCPECGIDYNRSQRRTLRARSLLIASAILASMLTPFLAAYSDVQAFDGSILRWALMKPQASSRSMMLIASENTLYSISDDRCNLTLRISLTNRGDTEVAYSINDRIQHIVLKSSTADTVQIPFGDGYAMVESRYWTPLYLYRYWIINYYNHRGPLKVTRRPADAAPVSTIK
jgi:hypothetical protein